MKGLLVSHVRLVTPPDPADMHGCREAPFRQQPLRDSVATSSSRLDKKTAAARHVRWLLFFV